MPLSGGTGTWSIRRHLARVLQTSEENVRQIADSMGLEPSRPIPASYRSHLYLSIIRRNWHLLPYEQLLELLDMNPRRWPRRCARMISCGSSSGRSSQSVTSLSTRLPMGRCWRCAQIEAMIKRDFPERPGEHVEPPLAFVDRLNGAIPDDRVRPARPDPDHPRFLYSYFAVFGDPLSDPSLDPYPDALLQRYADLGVNGVWLHVVAARSRHFSRFSGVWRRFAAAPGQFGKARRAGEAVQYRRLSLHERAARCRKNSSPRPIAANWRA